MQTSLRPLPSLLRPAHRTTSRQPPLDPLPLESAQLLNFSPILYFSPPILDSLSLPRNHVSSAGDHRIAVSIYLCEYELVLMRTQG